MRLAAAHKPDGLRCSVVYQNKAASTVAEHMRGTRRQQGGDGLASVLQIRPSATLKSVPSLGRWLPITCLWLGAVPAPGAPALPEPGVRPVHLGIHGIISEMPLSEMGWPG